jgi:hypothetical protein
VDLIELVDRHERWLEERRLEDEAVLAWLLARVA